MTEREIHLRRVLLTVDGKGKKAKEQALEELLSRNHPNDECIVKPNDCIVTVNKREL